MKVPNKSELEDAFQLRAGDAPIAAFLDVVEGIGLRHQFFCGRIYCSTARSYVSSLTVHLLIQNLVVAYVVGLQLFQLCDSTILIQRFEIGAQIFAVVLFDLAEVSSTVERSNVTLET